MIANNPSNGRVVKNSHYYIDGQRLHETDFRFDPEFPAKSSFITDILGLSKLLPLTYLNKKETISGSGIFIPEITSLEDISKRATEIEEGTVLAGGSDFFKALLEAKGSKVINNPQKYDIKVKQKRFIVFASTSEQSTKSESDMQQSDVPICNLPCAPADTSKLTGECLRKWVNNINTSFNKSNTVVSTVRQPVNNESGFPQSLNIFISQMITKILESEKLDELIVEGGGDRITSGKVSRME